MAWIGAAIAGAAGLVGGVMKNQGSVAQSDRQRTWESEMRDTQYQTAVRDMKAAGLNPMLAYSQGGAGTPASGMAQIEDVVSPAVNSAVSTYQAGIAAQQQKQQIEQSKAQTELIQAQAAATNATADNTRIDTVMKQAQTRYWDVMAPKVIADTNLSKAEKSKALQAISLMKLQGFDVIASTGNKNVDTVLKNLQANQYQAYSNFYGSKEGQLSPYVDFSLRSLNSAASILKPIGPRIDQSGSTFNRTTTNYEVK